MKQNLWNTLVFAGLVCLISSFQVLGQDYNIMQYGAKSDTTYLSTKAIQAAIDEAFNNGGGRVVFPAGSYKSGSVILKDNVDLHISSGAIWYGSQNISDYEQIKIQYVSLRTIEKTRQLIFAERAVNIAITGHGTIDGQGEVFKKEGNNDEGVGRPHLIRFSECQDVRIFDVTMRNAGAWMQHYLVCERVYIKGIKVFNRVNFNNDGIDIDGCNLVTISDVIIDSDDDGITLKSTSERPCENIVITNSIISSHCNAIKLGTETNGGFKNITISNCIIKPSEVKGKIYYGVRGGKSAISLQIVDGGTMDGITISNIFADSAAVPLFIRLGDRARPYRSDKPVDKVGSIKNISINHFQAINAQKIGSSILGIPGHPIENVKLSNISFTYSGGGTVEESLRAIPEMIDAYPEAVNFGPLNAFGLNIRHAINIEIHNSHFTTSEADYRPSIFIDRVNDVTITGLHLSGKGNREASIRYLEGKGLKVINSISNESASNFISIVNPDQKDFVLVNNVLFGDGKIINTNNKNIHKSNSNNNLIIK